MNKPFDRRYDRYLRRRRTITVTRIQNRKKEKKQNLLVNRIRFYVRRLFIISLNFNMNKWKRFGRLGECIEERESYEFPISNEYDKRTYHCRMTQRHKVLLRLYDDNDVMLYLCLKFVYYMSMGGCRLHLSYVRQMHGRCTLSTLHTVQCTSLKMGNNGHLFASHTDVHRT